MILRLIFALLLFASSLDSLTFGADDGVDVEDVTQEMLESTLPSGDGDPGDADDGVEVEDVTPEMLEGTLPAQQSDVIDEDYGDLSQESEEVVQTQSSDDATIQVNPQDPTLQQVINILEDDANRKELVTTLKALTQPINAQQQFIFVNSFLNIKNFLKSLVSEVKVFSKALTQKNTWTINLNKSVFQAFYNQNSTILFYIIISALVVQGTLAFFMRGAIPPFFSRFNREASIQIVMRTVVPMFIFFLVAHFAKAYFIGSAETQVYSDDILVNILMIQIVLMLVRLSISLGVIPVESNQQRSLYGFLIFFMFLWGVYTYYGNSIALPTIAGNLVSRPVAQLFWSLVTCLAVWFVYRYRNVIEGMLFRKIPFTENRMLKGVQQLISGNLHHLVGAGVILTYCAWFIKHQDTFVYFRNQILITISVLFALSVISRLLISSPNHLMLDSTEKAFSASNIVSYRLVDMSAFVAICYILYRWCAPLMEMRGINTSKISDKLLGIFIILALAILIIHGLNRLFNSSVIRAGENKHLKTFLPIIDKLSKLFVMVIAALLLLIELNVNVMPLIASFSVLGLGIGLASKTIIEDFINGLFILQENDFSIGDNVTIGGFKGVIDNITLRKVHIRDAQGAMNFIPFSTIGAITNHSRDFNADKVNIPLPSAFHLKRTISILEDVGQQLLLDPEIKDFIISPPRFVGVSDFQTTSSSISEVSTVMQFEIKTAPGKMTIITGEFRKLAKLAFEEMERIM